MTDDIEHIHNIPLTQLSAHPRNVRRNLGDLKDLTRSIRDRGIETPLVVLPADGAGIFHIVAGHRRRAAAESAGLESAPCIVRGYADEAKQAEMDKRLKQPEDPEADFTYRAGCTLLIDPQKMAVRRVIRTPGTVADEGEFRRLREFLFGGGLEPGNAYALATAALNAREPFALLHRHEG